MSAFELLSDVLIVAVCTASAVACFLVHRRIRRLDSTEIGIGKAIAEMSRSLARLQDALAAAEGAVSDASARLDPQIVQAKALAARLEVAGADRLIGRTSGAIRAALADPDPLAEVVPKGFPPDAGPVSRTGTKPRPDANGAGLARRGRDPRVGEAAA